VTRTTHPITRQSYRQAASLLARAFVNDPASVAVYRNFTPDRRERALTVDFSAEVLECVRRGYPLQMEEDGKLIAAAVIYPPGGYPLPVWIQWMFIIRSILGNGFYDIRSWVKWQNEVDKFHPNEPHFYLEYLAVEPEQQGKEAGSAFMREFTTKLDEEQVGCYLENANARNNPFYQRFGFQIMCEKEIIGVPTWMMWRPPINPGIW